MAASAASTAALAGCAASGPRFLDYDGPEVTLVVAQKGARTLQLFNNSTLLKSYHFELGFAPVGDKHFEGDGRTPEGLYFIDRSNPRSSYHLSVGISYPNDQDRAFAEAQGRRPGGDIFIHGTPREMRHKRDWTAGCLAVKNEEVEEIFSMVRAGTPILLTA